MSEQVSSELLGFGNRLSKAVESRQSQIVLGLDPNPAALWPVVGQQLSSNPTRAQVASACRDQCLRLIDAVAENCVAIKPQLACFERFGSDGWRALEDVTNYAQKFGLLVIADGKRGDVPVTAQAYAEALLPSELGYGLSADAVTANPLLGRDSIQPLVDSARESNTGVFLLVRTSNEGAKDLQDLKLESGLPVWHQLAQMADSFSKQDVVEKQVLSDIGAVVGATRPEFIETARELMPRAVFLMPGVGAQGGEVSDLAAAFLPSKAAGLVTASRSIANAYQATSKKPDVAAYDEAERIRSVAWGIS